MLSLRWGLSPRINGTDRRLTGDLIDACTPGIGTATTVSGSATISIWIRDYERFTSPCFRA